ncbi:molybdopterin synthase catalytic subunit 1 [Planococcus citri]|uniref:molybdopterin synthase catalytic subunit 1 n=1 Tax=Planococcus citri TaxID=170843 RepID=UPI0031F7F37C
MFDIKLSDSALHIDEIYRSVVSPRCGAVSLFVGTTRDNFEGLMVTKLIYESYEKMAIKMIRTVCEEILEKWTEIEHVAIHHRLGEVPVSEASVVIALSSPHRKDSLEALHYAIDRLKEIVPIFKKEHYQDGGAEWKQNAECSWSRCAAIPKHNNNF